MQTERRFPAAFAILTLVIGCPATPTDEAGDAGPVQEQPLVLTNPLVVYTLTPQEGAVEAPVAPPAKPEEGEERASYVVGTRDSDVRPMLTAVAEGRRSEIVVPEVLGDLTIDVASRWYEPAGDVDGNGHADRLLLRCAVVPRLGEVTTSAWIVAVLADDEGGIGPDQQKEGVVVAAALVAGEQCPLVVAEVAEDGKVTYDRLGKDGWQRVVATPRTATVEEKLAGDAERDVALVTSAMQVYDTGVLAPETAYVKAFIHKGFLPEVEAVEPTRDLIFPEVLMPLYGSLKVVEAKLRFADIADAYGAVDARTSIMTSILVHEGDLRLSLSAGELKRRVEGLQKLGTQFEEIEGALTLDGEKMRRRDFEIKLSQVADAGERARVVKTYQDFFRPVVAEGGQYEQFIAEMNEIARTHGFANYPDMRMVEKFGMDLDGFIEWTDQAWTNTDADALAFVTSLKAFAGTDALTYWQVGQLTDAWILDQVGMEALPTLGEEDAIGIMKQFFEDVGLDMEAAPYDRITHDWYQDDLKWNRSGTAATATPEDAYFTSNLKPGEPIPLDEWETPVHETAHTLHYQTSGQHGQLLSAYQNNMPSYVAEGVAMTMEEVPIGNPALMRRYFADKPGFTDELFEIYPGVKAQAVAWQTRRLLLMGLYEVNLYVDRNPDGSERPWVERVGAWEGMVRDRLFVEPPADALAQIMCRSHPFNDQSQLGYSSYSLGHALVRQIFRTSVLEGTDEELQRYGKAMIEVMSQGALADRASVQAVIDGLAQPHEESS